MDESESMCSAFLWSGTPNITSKWKVAWAEVCTPKKEGGLGVRRLKDVSLVFSLKLIWRLFHSTGSLWVEWLNQIILRGDSFWDAREGMWGSWIWRKMLQLRHIAKNFLRLEIHNGLSVGFCRDIWHPLDRLIEVIGERGTQKLGIARHTTVSKVLGDHVWWFRNTRDRDIEQVLLQIRGFRLRLVNNEEDTALWKREEDDYGREFSEHKTWDLIRNKHVIVPWSSLICFVQNVPRYAFITWLAVKNRLSTGVRMRVWGIIQGCMFCGEPEETRDHMFFACPYTYSLLLQVLGSLLRPVPSPDWNEIVSRIIGSSHDRLTSILLRLAFQVTIYYIWRERNERRHTQKSRLWSHLGRLIEKTIKLRILSTLYHEKPRPQVFFSAGSVHTLDDDRFLFYGFF